MHVQYSERSCKRTGTVYISSNWTNFSGRTNCEVDFWFTLTEHIQSKEGTGAPNGSFRGISVR